MKSRKLLLAVMIAVVLCLWSALVLFQRQGTQPGLEESAKAQQSADSALPFSRRAGKTENLRESTNTPDSPTVRSDAISNKYQSIYHAATAGDPEAQFTLGEILENCARSFTWSFDENDAPISLLAAQNKACKHFIDESADLRDGDLVHIASDWKQRASEGKSVRAQSMALLFGVADGDSEATAGGEGKLRNMLASGDAYVFFAISVLKDGREVRGDAPTPESVAWRLLACENEEMFIYGASNQEVSLLCDMGLPCETLTTEDYYYHAFPEIYDEARGYAMSLRQKLGQGQYEDIDLSFSLPANDGQ